MLKLLVNLEAESIRSRTRTHIKTRSRHIPKTAPAEAKTIEPREQHLVARMAHQARFTTTIATTTWGAGIAVDGEAAIIGA